MSKETKSKGLELRMLYLKQDSPPLTQSELPMWSVGLPLQTSLLFPKLPQTYTSTLKEAVLQDDSSLLQGQQRHAEPVARETDHHGQQAPDTDL